MIFIILLAWNYRWLGDTNIWRSSLGIKALRWNHLISVAVTLAPSLASMRALRIKVFIMTAGLISVGSLPPPPHYRHHRRHDHPHEPCPANALTSCSDHSSFSLNTTHVVFKKEICWNTCHTRNKNKSKRWPEMKTLYKWQKLFFFLIPSLSLCWQQ